jgi:hypothetical protein
MKTLKKSSICYMALAIALSCVPSAASAQVQGSGSPPAVDAPIKPFAGHIDPFAGHIDPFRGHIDPFAGHIDPFGGHIDPFGGHIDPFGGHIDPFKGHIDPFYNTAPKLNSVDVGKFWSTFSAGWSNADRLLGTQLATADNVAAVNVQLRTLIADSDTFWGERVKLRTGKSFQQGFVDPLLAKFGVSLSDPSSFLRLTPSQRSALAFAWYDGLQSFAGIDHVDHWMRTVRWNPEITRIQGSGAGSVIGLLDGDISMDENVRGNLIASDGYMNGANAHGSAVVSLLVGAHDGKGVQGIAPNAGVVAYNPFDSTNTASWQDISNGILSLKRQSKVSVINLSLGAPGFTFDPGWNQILNSRSITSYANNTVYVFAAGNDGITQTGNVPWTSFNYNSLIVVGSIRPDETISDFSNRPGTGCFSSGTYCRTGGNLMNRFIVAPGELILVSDGNGGVTRVSGTSFAAPLVSGAITLLHDRWQWLVNYPRETTEIVLQTARDLGAPGVDAVYGRGVLDVQASQSPINFNTLEFYEYDRSNNGVGPGKVRLAADLKKGGVQGAWETNDTYFYLIEKIGNTRRDFAVPLSSRLVGQKTGVGGTSEYFQSYVTSRFQDWIKSGIGFSDVASFNTPDRGGWNLTLQASNPYSNLDANQLISSPQSAVTISDPAGRLAFSGGHGDGGRTLLGANGFGLKSDFDVSNGGVNPLLGFASGGAFVDADVAIAKDLRLALGFTEKKLVQSQNPLLSQADRQNLIGLEAYRADAVNVRLTHTASDTASFTLNYTKLQEKNGLLGVQSTVASDLDSGSKSDTVTLGANLKLPSNFSLAASATGAITRTKDQADQAFTTGGRGVLSSAFAVSLTKKGVVGNTDALRLSVTQPLHIEKGSIDFKSIQIIDRTTGELGEATQRLDISEKSRRISSELLYSAPLTKNGEMSVFGRLDYRLNSTNTKNVDGMVIGGRVKLAF